MSNNIWAEVDDYFAPLYTPDDPVLDAALAAAQAAGMPPINVAANQGKLLHLLARSIGARRILEIGTLAGYSTIWLARALPEDGRLVTLEFAPKHATVATANIARAGLSGNVEVRVGRALDTLPQLAAEGAEPFDLIFIDADKGNLAEYLNWAVRLARTGSLIIADNVVRGGEVADPASPDKAVQGVRRFHTAQAANQRLLAVALQTVGSKGYDGLAIALVVG